MFNKVFNLFFSFLVFLLPLFFLPITSDFFDFNKNLLLFLLTALLLTFLATKTVLEKKLQLTKTPFDLLVLGFAFACLVSLIFASSNKVEALTMPLGTGTILALTILYFLLTNNLTNSKMLITSFLISASILSLFAVYQFIGVGEAIAPTDWLKNKAFTPAGGLLSLATFLGIMLFLAGGKTYLLLKARDKDSNSSSFLLFFYPLSLILTAAGLGVSIYQLLTSAKPIILPQGAGWIIALEAFKRFPLFGIGIENYLSAFTQGKPISLNLTPYWNLQFGISSNFYFHLLTTLGILGFGTWLLLVLKIIKSAKLNSPDNSFENKLLALSLFLILILLAFLPASFLLLFVFFVLLALLARGQKEETKEISSEPLIKGSLGLTILILFFSIYWLYRLWLGEFYFKSSLEALNQNRGTDAYNLQIKAIQKNPYNKIYRLVYSQTNFALANALAQKKDLSDQDRQNISQLIQQAIREAKTAITLGKINPQTWENLANLYRNLINFAQGADQWAIASYNQTILLDPANPNLRLNLGGLYYLLKNYDAAINQFILAVNLKPDFANGHYNLAAAYKEKGQIKNAVAEIETVLTLVEPNSNDFQKASQELADLKTKLPKEEQKTGQPETLTAPTATSPAGLKKPLELPEEAAPPTPQATPIPTLTPKETPKGE